MFLPPNVCLENKSTGLIHIPPNVTLRDAADDANLNLVSNLNPSYPLEFSVKQEDQSQGSKWKQLDFRTWVQVTEPNPINFYNFYHNSNENYNRSACYQHQYTDQSSVLPVNVPSDHCYYGNGQCTQMMDQYNVTDYRHLTPFHQNNFSLNQNNISHHQNNLFDPSPQYWKPPGIETFMDTLRRMDRVNQPMYTGYQNYTQTTKQAPKENQMNYFYPMTPCTFSDYRQFQNYSNTPQSALTSSEQFVSDTSYKTYFNSEDVRLQTMESMDSSENVQTQNIDLSDFSRPSCQYVHNNENDSFLENDKPSFFHGNPFAVNSSTSESDMKTSSGNAVRSLSFNEYCVEQDVEAEPGKYFSENSSSSSVWETRCPVNAFRPITSPLISPGTTPVNDGISASGNTSLTAPMNVQLSTALNNLMSTSVNTLSTTSVNALVLDPVTSPSGTQQNTTMTTSLTTFEEQLTMPLGNPLTSSSNIPAANPISSSLRTPKINPDTHSLTTQLTTSLTTPKNTPLTVPKTSPKQEIPPVVCVPCEIDLLEPGWNGNLAVQTVTIDWLQLNPQLVQTSAEESTDAASKINNQNTVTVTKDTSKVGKLYTGNPTLAKTSLGKLNCTEDFTAPSTVNSQHTASVQYLPGIGSSVPEENVQKEFDATAQHYKLNVVQTKNVPKLSPIEGNKWKDFDKTRKTLEHRFKISEDTVNNMAKLTHAELMDSKGLHHQRNQMLSVRNAIPSLETLTTDSSVSECS